MHTQPIESLARVATTAAMSGTDLQGTRLQMVVASAAALAALLTLAALSAYKPHGMTPYGQRSMSQP